LHRVLIYYYTLYEAQGVCKTGDKNSTKYSTQTINMECKN